MPLLLLIGEPDTLAYPTHRQLCSSLRGPENKYLRRAECLDNGIYIADPATGLMLETTASGFYTYRRGAWIGDNLDHWNVPWPCELLEFDGDSFCALMHALHTKHPREDPDAPAKFTLVGDSVSIRQQHGLAGALRNKHEPPYARTETGDVQVFCNGSVSFAFMRNDNLREYKTVHENGVQRRRPLKWVKAICESDLAVFNFGAHADGILHFNETLSEAAEALNRACGADIASGKAKLFFRTTIEGQPFCHSPNLEIKYIANMPSWKNHVWPVLTGQDQSPDPKAYDIRFHWHAFQHYNAIAASILRPLGVGILDVVPMSRLHPTTDMMHDCMHTNGAIEKWNSLLLSAAYADMCLLRTGRHRNIGARPSEAPAVLFSEKALANPEV